MLHDVLVVFEQQLCGQICQIEELCSERMVEMVDIVFVQPFQFLITQMLRQILKPLHTKKG